MDNYLWFHEKIIVKIFRVFLQQDRKVAILKLYRAELDAMENINIFKNLIKPINICRGIKIYTAFKSQIVLVLGDVNSFTTKWKWYILQQFKVEWYFFSVSVLLFFLWDTLAPKLLNQLKKNRTVPESRISEDFKTGFGLVITWKIRNPWS